MKGYFSLFAFTGLFAVTSSLFGGGGKQKWDGLRLPWNLNPFSDGFTGLPRDKNLDDMTGYSFQANFCQNNLKFRGYRYWHNSDPTFMLLFDINGYIAGIQYAINAADYTPSKIMSGHPVITDTINGKLYNVITVYFVDPAIICTTGRSKTDFANNGTGNRLVIQNGSSTDPANLINIPLSESEIQAKMPQWVGPKCFYTMGNHYWLNIQPDMSCDNFFPICLLYSGGQLRAFCYGTNANWNDDFVDNPHPSAGVLAQFFKEGHVPTCFAENPKYQSLTTMHVFLTNHPRTGDDNC